MTSGHRDPTGDEDADYGTTARRDKKRLWTNAAAFPFALLLIVAGAFVICLLTR